MTSPYLMDHQTLKTRPKTIRELQPAVFWDASTLTAADGAAIASWTDRMGGVVISQGTADLKPIRLAVGIGNRSCALFDGTNDVLAATAVPMTGAAWTIVASIQLLAATSAAHRIVFWEDDGTANNLIAVGVNTAGKPYIYTRQAASFKTAFGATVLDTEPHTIVYGTNAAGNAWEIFVDGVAEDMSGSTGNVGNGFDDYGTLTRCSVGGSLTTLYFAGKIALIAGWNARI